VRVDVRLYASLADRYGRRPEGGAMELPEGATVGALLSAFGIDPDEVHLVIIDGRIVRDLQSPIRDGARIALFPPVGGG